LSVIDDAARQAEDDAKRASQIDINIDDDPSGPMCATAGGKPMSLLGVPYQGGPNVHGMVTALADTNPLRVVLTRKEQDIRKLAEQQGADMKAFPGGGSYSWKATVDALESDIAWFSSVISGREKSIADLKKTKEEILHDDPNSSVASIDQAIADHEKELNNARKNLNSAQARLPQAQAGLARFESTMMAANMAKDNAERAALAAAAACP
jgi:hypothetical protein